MQFFQIIKQKIKIVFKNLKKLSFICGRKYMIICIS